MFGNRYFTGRYFPDRYFPPGSDAVADDGLLGGKAYSYDTPYERYKRDKAEEARLSREIAAKERQLELERARAAKLLEQRNNEILARQLELEEALIREEINRLLELKAALIRRIDDEEVILVILMSMPFSS